MDARGLAILGGALGLVFATRSGLGERLDEGLVLSAMQRALVQRQPAPGLLHHSDRGSQYCSDKYLALLQAHNIVRSMSRTADCLDNAVSENFFGTLKDEL